MKKIFTILLVSFLAINTSFAQFGGGGGFGQGTVILGATTELSDVGWSVVAMEPSIGYFISDNVAIGLGFSLGTTTDEEEYEWPNPSGGTDEWTETITISDMTIGPWLRLYVGEMFFINAGVEIGSGSATNKTTDKDNSGWTDSDGNLVSKMTDKTASFGLDIGAGASIFWGDHIAFEPMFVFTMGSSSETPFDQDTEKGPSTINLGFKIGVCLMLNN